MLNNKLFLTLLLINFFFSSKAQWNNSTVFNTAIVIQPKSQQNIHTISDTKNGAVIAWDDNRNILTNSTDVYTQRIKSNGFGKWTSGGVPICTAIGVQKSNNITSGGPDGSAIITWEDSRDGNYDIYAQKIDSSGNILWGTNGVVVCNRATNQKNPKIVSDSNGGAIIVWEDSASFYFDIYAQRISFDGIVQWAPNGIGICVVPNQQQNPTIESDVLGGAIITWQDKRSNVDYDIYAQQISANGTLGWASNGLVVCNAANTQSNPKIEPDGNNGAIIGWIDKRNAIDNNIYSQRINSTGNVLWTNNGVMVCGASNNQSALEMKYIGSTGVVYSWKDDRTSFNQIYAQLINLSGIEQLTSNGIQLSSGLRSINPNSTQDGSGGVIIAWQDSTSLGWDIKSQKLDANGSVQWLNGGVIVSDAGFDQTSVSQTIDGTGGAIYIWEDRRNGSDAEIYAHHLFYNGSEFVGINELTKSKLSILTYPNPATDFIQFKVEEKFEDADCTIDLFDDLGKKIQTIKTTILKNKITISNLNLKSGLYFYNLTLQNNEGSTTGKFLINK
jgi:hypothetical protein